MKPLRLGIIGCGNVLSAYRAAILPLQHQNLATVTYLCGRKDQQPSALEGFLPKPRFVTQPKSLLNSREVDVVIILTSMPQHAQLAREALSAGKHVLVEKTLAGSVAEATKLMALARSKGCLLVAAPFTMLSPTSMRMAGIIRGGGIGKPCSARARYGWAGPTWSSWFYQPGGGCLFDLGVYSFTTLTGLLGPAQRVTAFTGVAIPKRVIRGKRIRVEAEDNAQVLLDFGNACLGVVTTGFTLQQYRSPALEIYATQGTLQMLGDDWDPDGFEWWENRVGAWKSYKETHPDWSWTDGLRHLVECIHAHTQPRTSPEHARHVIEIMLAAQQSSREGRAIPLQTTFHPPSIPASQDLEPAHLQHDRSRQHPRHTAPSGARR